MTSIHVILIMHNTGTSSKWKKTKVNKMHTEWVKAVDNIHTYIYLTYYYYYYSVCVTWEHDGMTRLGHFVLV